MLLRHPHSIFNGLSNERPFHQVMDANSRLAAIGINETEIAKILKNKKLTERLLATIDMAGCPNPIPESDAAVWKSRGPLIQKICQKELASAPLLAKYVGDGRIACAEQLEAAIEFTSAKSDFTPEEFDAAAGVGITVTDAEIAEAVASVITSLAAEISKNAQPMKSLGIVLGALKKNVPKMKFASRQKTAEEVKKQLSSFTPVAAAPAPAKPEKPAPKQEKPAAAPAQDEEPEMDFQGIVARFPTPQDNAMNNSPEIQAEHLKITDGKFMTRFPPEPNGWIHIGHAKAMYLDFGLAAEKKGLCYMRFDDTNPAKEKDEFIEGIKKDVKWMGFSWWKITHTSDYFHQLYEYAVRLIKEGKAYVCHQTKEEVAASRKTREPSPWRDRPIEESLREFELMRCGFFAPSEATLRLKMDLTSNNPNMYDQVAYRIVYRPHPRTNDEWCIYPTYDYSHCMIDSLEHVTHSLCTLEFENRRDSYYWVLDALGIYKPFVWEMSRLNLTHTVMSKRRLQALVYDHLVSGWDDPRMPTIAGLRRKGYTASAIREFVKQAGFTRNVTSTIDYQKLEFVQQKELDETSPRAFCVLYPLKVTIANIDGDVKVTAPIFPKDPSRGNREMTLSKVVYIEKDDFMLNPVKGFKRLTPTSVVCLKWANINIKVVKTVGEGDNLELICETTDEKASAFIQWCSESCPRAEVRLYDKLFKSANPMAVEGDWKLDLNPDSLKVVPNALVEPFAAHPKEYDHFQFERIGFFTADMDTTPEKPVFNLTVPLKIGKF